MINVVLDTNILHQEGLFSRNMQLLTRLASFDQVSISIPQLVKREYLSKIDAESVSSLQSINAKLGDMLKKARRRSLMHDELTQVQATLNNVAKHFGASIEEDFAVWQHSTKANILEFDPDQFDSVFNHYFAGSGVFRQPKHRADLPDAFINSCIEALVSETRTVDVIIKDGAFRQHLEKLDGVSVYDGLDSYLQAPHIVEKIKLLDARSQRTETLKRFFASMSFQEHANKFLCSSEDGILDIRVEGNNITGLNVLGLSSVSNSVVYFIDTESISEMQYGGVDQIDEGHFSIEIFFMADASIDYVAEQGEFHKLPKRRRDEIDILERLDNFYDLTEDRFFAFAGHAEIRFDPGFSAAELATHAQYLDSGHSKISIEFDIDKAEIMAVVPHAADISADT